MKRFLDSLNCCGSNSSQSSFASSASGMNQNESRPAQNNNNPPIREVLRCGLYLDHNLPLGDFASVWNFLDNRLGRVSEHSRGTIPHNYPGVTAVTLNHNERIIYFQILKTESAFLDDMKRWPQVTSVKVEPADFTYSIL